MIENLPSHTANEARILIPQSDSKLKLSPMTQIAKNHIYHLLQH